MLGPSHIRKISSTPPRDYTTSVTVFWERSIGRRDANAKTGPNEETVKRVQELSRMLLLSLLVLLPEDYRLFVRQYITFFGTVYFYFDKIRITIKTCLINQDSMNSAWDSTKMQLNCIVRVDGDHMGKTMDFKNLILLLILLLQRACYVSKITRWSTPVLVVPCLKTVHSTWFTVFIIDGLNGIWV